MGDILVLGLGSMGKRRIRCLKALGYSNIVGVDVRDDRAKEAMSSLSITTYKDLQSLKDSFRFDFAFICLPPDIHNLGIFWCFKRGIACFVEASVLIDDVEVVLNSGANADNIVPSSTLSFHPAIKKIKNMVKSNKYGKVSNVILHSGHYLPYWHKYEDVSEYYVSNKSTGGAREIVPFELTWLTDIFGLPGQSTSMIKKTISIDGAPQIDDTYNILLSFGSFLANITVDVVSQNATRQLTINFEKAQLRWNWEDDFLTVYTDDENPAIKLYYSKGSSADGYNKNIAENMYIEETKRFIAHLSHREPFPNTLEKDHKVLQILHDVEKQNVLQIGRRIK